MADGGSINLRLSLKGAEQVRAELDKIGPSGAKMGRELDRAMRAPGPGLQALDTGMKSARGGLEGFAGRIGPVGSGLAGLGAAGLAVAAGVTAAVVATAAAVQQAMAAVRFADDLEDAAGKINIGVEALQEWRFAAAEAGATAADADSAIDSFQKKLGEAMAGGRSVKWFERLGFSAADLKAFDGTEDALDAVIDKIAGLGTEAERAAVAEKLGLGPLIPLVRQGADAIDDMRARARELGIVMDEEMVKRGAETSREMEILAQKIDMQLKQAFVDMGPAIVAVMGLVGQLAGALNDLANSWKAFDLKSSDYLQREDQRLSRQITALLDRSGANSPDELSPSERTVFNRANDRRGRIAVELADRARERAAAPAPSPVPAVTLRDLSGGGGASKAAQEAERRERERERLFDQLDREMLSSRRDVTRERWNDDTSAARAQLAKSLLALDRQERDAKLAEMESELQRLNGLDERRRLLFEQIRAMNAETDAAQDAEIIETQRREHAEAMRAAEDAHLEITTEILSLASSTARTSDERRVIELSLLEIAQRRQRADLEAAIEAEKEPEARARLVEALARLPALFEAQARAVERQNANPVRRWQEAQFQTGGEAAEWVQGAALDALDGMNKGLRDACKNADSAGDAFKRMGDVAVDALGRVVDALLEVALQRMLIEPLVGALFGGGQTGGAGGSGGGGLLGSFLNNFVGAIFGGGGGQGAPMFGGGAKGNPPGILSLGSLPRKARGGLHSAAGRVLLGEYGMETADLPIGSRIYDTDRTERTLLDFDNRMRARGEGGGASPTINLTARVINQTSEPVQAKMKQTPTGLDIILEPAVRAGVARMASDGSLDRVQGLRPKPIRR